MIIQRLEQVLKAFIAAIFLFFVSITFAQVILRYGFSASIAWFDELSRYAFIWMVILAAAVMTRHGAHIAVDIIDELASPRLRKVLLVLSDLSMIVFAAIVGVGGWRLMQANWNTVGPASRVPIAWVQMVLPAFGLLVTIFVTVRLIDILRNPSPDEEKG